MKDKEASIHQQVVDWLKWQHPKVIFRTDYAAGLKMSIGQAMKMKRLQQSKAYPDLFIAEPRGKEHGLFIELKRDRSEVYLKSGQLCSKEHIKEQDAMLKKLWALGYAAEFGFGFEHTIKIINDYLKV